MDHAHLNAYHKPSFSYIEKKKQNENKYKNMKYD
jgi:hypothetical protein